MPKFCPYCGEKTDNDAEFCSDCGCKISDALTVVCPSCGTKNHPEAQYCKKCGEELPKHNRIVYCPDCGKPSIQPVFYCAYCGANLEDDTEKPNFNTNPEPEPRPSVLERIFSFIRHHLIVSVAFLLALYIVSQIVSGCVSSAPKSPLGSRSNPYTANTTVATTKAKDTEPDTTKPTELDISGLTLSDSCATLANLYDDCVYEISEELVTFTMPKPDSLFASMDMSVMRQRIYYIFSMLSEREDVDMLFVFFDTPVVGGGTVHAVYASITGDTLRSVDFSTVSSSTIDQICYTWYVHPNLK